MNISYLKNLFRPFYYNLKESRNIFLIQTTSIIHCNHKQYISIWERALSFWGLKTYTIKSVEEYGCEKKLSSLMVSRKRFGESFELIYSIDAQPKVYSSPLPDLLLTSFPNVFIIGGCDCIVDYNNNIIISDVSASIDTNVYENAKGFIESQHEKYAIAKTINHYSRITSGISICSYFSNSYYHSFYDSLQKLYIINSLDIKQDVPLIVDIDIKSIPQLFEIFLLLNKKKRDVIWVEKRSVLMVDNLYYLNSVHIQPNQIKKINKIECADFKYDITALRSFREACLKIKDQQTYPKKIFLSRRGHTRRKYNEGDIIKVVRRHGFEIIYPETYSFKQQVSLFNQADLIVGPTGAAFTNILFCHSNAVAICFMGKKMNIPIFTAGSNVADAKLVYFIGKNTSLTASSHEIQSDYEIDVSKFELFLDDVEKYSLPKEDNIGTITL